MAEPPEWGRRKLLAGLVGGVLTAVVLLVGLGLSIYYTLQPDTSRTPDQGAEVSAAADPRDELADRPMPTAPADASRPGPLTTEPFESLLLPGARRLGAADVSTGFPQTKEGALAQLIAIDQAALQSASVPGAQAVITAWAVPGGPTAESWSGVKAIAEMSSADLPASGSPSLTVSATPEMGLVKGDRRRGVRGRVRRLRRDRDRDHHGQSRRSGLPTNGLVRRALDDRAGARAGAAAVCVAGH